MKFTSYLFIPVVFACIGLNSTAQTLVNINWETLSGTSTIQKSSGGLAFDNNSNLIVVNSIAEPGEGHNIKTSCIGPDGNMIWTKKHNGPNNLDDIAAKCEVSGSGNIYTIGTIETTNNGTDWVIIKYDANGAQQWLSTYNGPANSDDYPIDLGFDAQGNIVVSGISKAANGLSDIFVQKYKPTGALLWEHRYDNGWEDFPTQCLITPQGRLLIAGSSGSSTSNSDAFILNLNLADGSHKECVFPSRNKYP